MICVESPVKSPVAIIPWMPHYEGLAESAMVDLWSRIHEDGLYATVFHEAPTMTLANYMAFFSKPSTSVQILCHVDEAGAFDLAGLAWLSEFEQLPSHRRATGSFCILKKYWGRAFTDVLAPVLFPYWFKPVAEGGLGVDVLVGMTPVKNRRAMRFCRSIGLRYMCQLPGYTSFCGEPCDAAIGVMTRKDYEDRYCQQATTMT